jgi:hypothetical protein
VEHAFTDQMVRADREDLTAAALQYLEKYKGNFQPILDARQAFAEGYELNVAEIRMILNVMRADTSIRMEYTPPAGQVIKFPDRGIFREEKVVPTPPKFQEVRVRTQIKSKYVFGMSMHKRAETIHYLDHSKTEGVFKQAGARSYAGRLSVRPFAQGHGWHQIWFDRIEVSISWRCSVMNPHVRLLTSTEAHKLLSEGRKRLCPQCRRCVR